MPDTLPRSEAAGPSFPVKRARLGDDKNRGDSPPSPTGAGSITTTLYGGPVAHSNTPDRPYFERRASICTEHSPLLSERESIFATHYRPVENETSTLHLPPLAGALAEPSAPGALEADMEFSLPPLLPTPSKLSLRSSLTGARSGPGGVAAGGLKQYGAGGSDKSVDRQMQASKSIAYGIRRVASDGHPWAKNFHVNGGFSPQLHGTDQFPATAQEIPPMEDASAPTDANAVQHKDEQEHRHEHGQGAQRQSAMSQAMRPTRSERSVSRGRTHVDKSIEATLTNAEPGQNIRSRKSSHLMGVFRENTSPLESRPRESNVPAAEEGDYTQTASRPGVHVGRTLSRPTIATATEAISPQPESIPAEIARPEPNYSGVFTPDQTLDTETPSRQFSTTPTLPQSPPAQPNLHSKHEHDPYFRKQDATKQSTGSLVPSIPPNLLEQIRQYHNLTPTRGQSAHLPKRHTGVRSQQDTNLADRGQVAAGDGGGQSEESEEHISSAVYFPHPVPVEDLEQFSSPEVGPLVARDKTKTGAPVAGGAQNHHDAKRPSADLAPPEHIDISVQSKHEKRVFHGDYQPPDEVPYDGLERDHLATIKERPAESYAVASDSEIESSEDLGAASQTDDGDITPTATPIPTSQFRRGKRPSISAGPRGAVLLEPYSHQVGGHSTIFRFSRRAVCKQLNNRENEFYERIERRHPDMLRFLPRYIGVLNVTFSKGPKPSKETSSDTPQIPQTSKDPSMEAGETEARDTRLADSTKKRSSPRISTIEQRIVSQSQQIGERPQVILEQNRHIVPFSLFDSARRSRTSELQPSTDPGPFKPDDSKATPGNRRQAVTPTDSSSGRLTLPSPPSWGKTSVNSKFGEQILLSVFAPLPIQNHKKHAKGHTTLPRPREPSIRRRGHRSADPIRQGQPGESMSAAHGQESAQADDVDATKPGTVGNQKPRATAATATQPDADSHAGSASGDVSHGLERVMTTNSISCEGPPAGRPSNNIRRRHSGMGLRRRGTSVHDKSRGNLEYYEEDGYGGDSEEEVLRGGGGGGGGGGEAGKALFNGVSNPVRQDPGMPPGSTTVLSAAVDVQAQANVDNSLNSTSTSGGAKPPSPSQRLLPNHLPLNPKEAQLAKPDQRVVLFLLLEDLTADMGRPCVLDLKMGTRQYGIEASPTKVESQRRKCKTTTSQQLGVRICGMQTFDVRKQQPAYEDKYFGRDLKAGRELREALTRFLYDGVSYASVTKRIPTILDKISKLESMVRRLPGYRFYASSLLMLYDAEPEKSQRAKENAAAKIKGHGDKSSPETERDKEKDGKWPPPIELKIVDFANCVTGEDPLPPDAPCPPFHPGSVDRGYLRGLRTLKMYFQRILRDITESEFLERGDSEATGVDLVGAAGTHGGSEIVMEEDEGEVSI